MYKNSVRVFISPPNRRYGFSPHPHLIVVDTFGEGRAGYYPAELINSSISHSFSTSLQKRGERRDKVALKNKNSTILREIFGKGGLSN